MGIETSMYIKTDLLKKLDETATKMDISRSKLISLLIMKYMDKIQPTDNLFKSLKYQDSDDEAVFTTKSIYLREDAYEVWGDLRKVYKFSGSLVIALAIELYLDELLNGDLPHNYGEFYALSAGYSGKSYIFTRIWGLPTEKILNHLLETWEGS